MDELPNGIRIQLRDSCRAIIRDAESRIQRGTVMVSNGAEVNDARVRSRGFSGYCPPKRQATAWQGIEFGPSRPGPGTI